MTLCPCKGLLSLKVKKKFFNYRTYQKAKNHIKLSATIFGFGSSITEGTEPKSLGLVISDQCRLGFSCQGKFLL